VLELAIPSRYKLGISSIVSLSPGSFDEFTTALSSVPRSSTTARELTDQIASKMTRPDVNSLGMILEALAAMYRARLSAKVPLEEFVSDVWQTAVLEDFSEWGISESQRENFVERLKHALEHDALDILETKGRELQTEFERTFCDVRILTDLRPVFGDDINAPPRAVVVVHTLKLGFDVGEHKKHHDIYLSLDAEDIIKLRGALDRAEAKAKILHRISGIKDLEIFKF